MKQNQKKVLLIILLIIISLGILIPIIVLKSINPFKPSFYSYSSYADQKTIQKVNKNYTYKEYGSVNEFEYALENNKAIAGITSDYSIISLILNEKISPISYEVCEINKNNGVELDKWEEYFSEASQIQMHFYDKYLNEEFQKKLNEKYPEYGENYNFKFSDFVIPYFINDKVLAYDTKKVLNEINTDMNPLKFTETPTLKDALKKLHENKSNIKIQWTKNERENVVMGSDLENGTWNTEITKNNYLIWLNNFASIVKEGTGASISDIKRNLFDSDSDIILNNLINPDSKIQAAFIYNGDALDAYYGHDNFQEVNDGDRLRIIRTKTTVRVLDAFVVSSSINKNERMNLLRNFNDIFIEDIFKTKDEIIKDYDIDKNDIYKNNNILRIFDYVNYTPCAKGAYEYIYDNYFNDDENNVDEIARDIYEISPPASGNFIQGIGLIEKEVLSKLTTAFQRKLNGY